MTDDIGVSIVKQNFGTFKDATSNPKTSLVEGEFKYIENIPKEKLLYSTVDSKKVYRYTRNQKARETKSTEFKKLRKPNDTQECENRLSRCSALTVKKESFVEYLRAQFTPTIKSNLVLIKFNQTNAYRRALGKILETAV
ncbi:hypothetical protein MFLAVUS_010067 [Mucor flavus]|uniref:Uncharacterized protein n=1 Tax=Mucor flavus TaxID=439312 RepID=A0ABP9ZBN4_9FUNG